MAVFCHVTQRSRRWQSPYLDISACRMSVKITASFMNDSIVLETVFSLIKTAFFSYNTCKGVSKIWGYISSCKQTLLFPPPIRRPSSLLRVLTHWLLENPINSGHLYHLTLLTCSGYLLALVIGFRRKLSLSRHMSVVHTVDRNNKVLHYSGNGMV
jgi:hypothetical protein